VEKDNLTLKRASASRPSGERSDDDYDVLAEGIVVGRILKAAASPVRTPWMWTLAYGHHDGCIRQKLATRITVLRHEKENSSPD
jgi:hypothetical protein